MDLLKVDFPTTYNLMKRFMTSIFKKFPEKVPITLCSPLGLSRHFLTCHSHPALLGPALISPLLFQEQESRLCWHPDGETASDLSPDIGEINFLVFLHFLFLIQQFNVLLPSFFYSLASQHQMLYHFSSSQPLKRSWSQPLARFRTHQEVRTQYQHYYLDGISSGNKD